MFDYTDLIPAVRRAINDNPDSHTDITDETSSDTFFIILENEGYATIPEGGLNINGIPMEQNAYSITKNVIKCAVVIPAGSQILVQYESVRYTDETLGAYIGDTIRYVIQPIFNVDFGFEDGTETELSPDTDLTALFVLGTTLNISGIKLTEAGDDSIYIKDGDTVVDTTKSSSEKARGHEIMLKNWNETLKRVQINRFSGAVQY